MDLLPGNHFLKRHPLFFVIDIDHGTNLQPPMRTSNTPFAHQLCDAREKATITPPRALYSQQSLLLCRPLLEMGLE